MTAVNGQLLLHVIEAKLERDTSTFGTMDPYVTMKYRHQDFKTDECTDGGVHPKWEAIFDVDVKYVGDDLELEVYTNNTFTKDSSIGKAVVKLSGMCVYGGLDEWWAIQHKGVTAGNIHLKGEWIPVDAPKEEEEKEEKAEEAVRPAPAAPQQAPY